MEPPRRGRSLWTCGSLVWSQTWSRKAAFSACRAGEQPHKAVVLLAEIQLSGLVSMRHHSGTVISHCVEAKGITRSHRACEKAMPPHKAMELSAGMRGVA